MDISGKMKEIYTPEKFKGLLNKIEIKDVIMYRDYIERIFLSRIKKTFKCWIWLGGKTIKGYGVIKIKGRNELAHRLSYELYSGKIPKNMMVCHSCDNPKCVNPEHLWIGTRSDNMKDAFKKGRIRKHCLGNNLNGEKSPLSKIKEKDVVFIRENHKIMSARELSKKFNVHPRTIQKVWYRETWKHITP